MSDSQFEMGHAVLNGVDFRCHGFTEYLYGERVEYAWLMQLVVGRIGGAFSTQQVRNERTNKYYYIKFYLVLDVFSLHSSSLP